MNRTDYIKSLFSYDDETGILFWAVDKGTAKSGDGVGAVNSHGYLVTKIDGRMEIVHRLIWEINTGEIPDQIDHIDGDRTNNRMSNIRNVPHITNGRNQKKSEINTSGFSGVYWGKDRLLWGVRISNGGKRIRVGRFSTLLDAVSARIGAKRKYGYHENHGR